MTRENPLPRLVLRAIRSLTDQSGNPPSMRSLLAVVPGEPLAVISTVRKLDEEGYVDARRMRLTLRGFAAAVAPSFVAFERRSRVRGSALRKAVRVA